MQVTLECIGEAPEGADITVKCNETGIVFKHAYLVEYQHISGQVSGVVSLVPQYQQCLLIIVFNNAIGNSEPLVLTLGKYCL